MTVNALNPSLSTLAAAPARSAASTPANPAEPQDSVELPGSEYGTIDTVQEAATHPILDPALQFLLFTAASLAGKEGVWFTALNTEVMNGEARFSHGYHLNHEADENGYVGSGGGLVAMNYFSGTTIRAQQDGTVLLEERFGDNDSKLTIAPAQDGTHITGNIGHIAADLTLNLVFDNTGIHLTTNGTLGGQEYALNTNINGSMSARGHVGDQEIHKDYTISQNPQEGEVTVHGEGSAAGVAQTVDLSLRAIPQQQEPAPPQG